MRAPALATLLLFCAGCGLVPGHHPREGGRVLGTPTGGLRTLQDRIGVIHVHTKRSHDSAGRLADVLRGARDARIHFVVITDHNNLSMRPFEGLHRDVLLLVGTELSTSSGHLLALGVTHLPDRRAPLPEILAACEADGGFGIIAHPDAPSGGWRDERTEGIRGLEVYNLYTDITDESSLWTAVRLLLYPFRPGLLLSTIVDLPPAPLSRWDRLLARGPAVGIAGTDAHGPTLRLGWRNIDSYASTFRIVRNHVLVDRLEPDAVLEAIRAGRLHVGFDVWGDTTSFLWAATTPDGRMAVSGERLPFVAGTTLQVRAPHRGRIRIYRDGSRVFRRSARHVSWEAPGPGVYRVEIWKPALAGLTEVPWIISNPIRLE